ncbi:hypothetical protein BGZ73_008183 [Actinomortierella ambigua]|nr:hypothetical protein BGZ73_008183 [Actinomortierella ambigua]
MPFLSKEWADSIIELPTLTFHTDWLPLSIFSALHGIRIAMAYRQAIEAAAEQSRLNGDKVPKPYRVSWGQGLVSCLATALGGGFTTSMLLGMPPAWLGSNVVVPTYTLTFFLIQYTFLYDFLRKTIPATLLDSVLIFADASLRGLSISKLGVDGSRMRFAADRHAPGGGPNAGAEPWFAMLFLGTISGCGGGMWADVLKLKTHQWTWSTPAWAHAATWDMKAALTSAIFYATSTSPQVYQYLYGKDEAALNPNASGSRHHHVVVETEQEDLHSEATITTTTTITTKKRTARRSPVGYRARRSNVKGEDSVVGGETAEEDYEDDEEERLALEKELSRLEQQGEKDDDYDEDEAPSRSSTSSARGGRRRGAKAGSATGAEVVVTASRTSTRRRKPTRQEL